MLDKPCSLCTPPAQADGSPGGVPMAGARTRPCAGRAALSRPMRATCSPWGQRAGRGPRTRGGAAPQRPWSDFYRQGGKRCWEGRRRVTVRGAGGPRSPAVTSGCADKPQPRLLAATTRSHVWARPLARKTTWSSHLKTEVPVRPACSWQPVPTSRPCAAHRASGPGAQRKGTARRPQGPPLTPTGLVSPLLPGAGPHGAIRHGRVWYHVRWQPRAPARKLTAISLSGSHPSWVKGHYQNYSHRLTTAGSRQRRHCITRTWVTEARLNPKGACPPLPSLPSFSWFLRVLSFPAPTSRHGEVTSGPPQAWSSLLPWVCFQRRITPRKVRPLQDGGWVGWGCFPIKPRLRTVPPPALASKCQNKPFHGPVPLQVWFPQLRPA